jgi:hypothetical protein
MTIQPTSGPAVVGGDGVFDNTTTNESTVSAVDRSVLPLILVTR